MFEELYEPYPDASKYLEKLGVKPQEPSLAYLDELIKAHQRRIPFEDIDVFEKGIVPSLAPADLYDKFVVRNRGGYCFEINASFYYLLTACEFTTKAVLGRVVEGGSDRTPALHRDTMVELDGVWYFCDVGFGGVMPDYPLALQEGEPSDEYGSFWFEKVRDHWWNLQRHGHDGIYTVVQICDLAQEPVDFVTANFFCAGDPNSIFRKAMLTNIRLANGSKAIEGNTFYITQDDVRTPHEIADREELEQILWEHFHIKLD